MKRNRGSNPTTTVAPGGGEWVSILFVKFDPDKLGAIDPGVRGHFEKIR